MKPTLPLTLLLLTAALLALPSLRAGEQYALLVAISDYPDVPGRNADLSACRNDAAAVREWLQTQYGFPDEHILECYDGGATTEKITAALEQLVSVVKPGDAVMFYYSGHGTQVMDADGDEADRKDEALATWDMVADIAAGERNPEHWFTDDVICYYLSRLQTNRVLVFFDCCHSGTGTRSFGDFFGPGARKVGDEEVQVKYLPTGFFWNLNSTGKRPPKPDTQLFSVNGLHTLAAACRAEEEALALQSQSLMTQLFLAEVADPGKRSMPMSDLGILTTRQVSLAVDQLRARQPSIATQTPQFEGNTKWSLDQLLSKNPDGSDTRAFAPPKIDTDSIPTPRESRLLSRGDFGLTLTTPKSRYEEGEFMEVTVESAVEGYLRLYYIDAAGGTYQLFPNEASGADRILANTPFKVPDSGAYDLEMTAPYGQEMLKAVVSTTPFPKGGEGELAEESISELGSRGIRVKVNQKVAEALTFYQVVGKK